MTRLPSLRCISVVCAVMVANCSTNSAVGWRRVDQTTPVKSHDLVWIWSRTGTSKWYAVRVTQDSVSGLPYEMPWTCDSCRRSLPRSVVDSMQVGYEIHRSDSKTILEVAGAVGAALLIEIAICTAIGARSC